MSEPTLGLPPAAGPGDLSGGAEVSSACADALRRAGRYLAARARSEQEVRRKLQEAGYGGAVVDQVVDRLKQLRLIDDRAFARAWIGDRAARKGVAGRVLVAELEAKGVDRDTAESALTEVAVDDDRRARDLAARLLPKVVRLPLALQAVRLQAMLLRRGFEPEAAEAAVVAVLPPEGWD